MNIMTWTFVVVCILLSLLLFLPFIPLPFGIKVRVVTTNGMNHCCPETQGAFLAYWEGRGYNILNIPFNNGINTGDMIFIIKTNYSVGDVISYTISPISKNFKIHRIVEYNGTHFSTIYDRAFSYEKLKNTTVVLAKYKGAILLVEDIENVSDELEIFNGTLIQMSYRAVDIPVSRIEGKVIFRIPKLGILHVIILCLKNPECELVQCLQKGECNLMGFGTQ